MSRTRNVIINSISGSVCAFVSLFCNYAVRVVIAKYLGEQLFGINSMFSTLLSAMQILDVGFGSAIIIHMYKAMAKQEIDKICDLVKYYKYIYIGFAGVIIAGGFVINTFFISSIIITTIDYGKVRLYFALFLLGIVLKYLTSYKNCVLYADQKNRIITNIKLIVDFLFACIELTAIIITCNFYVYLIIKAFQEISTNLFVIRYVNKHYSYIDIRNRKFNKPLGKDLFETIKPMAVHRISETVTTSSSSLIMGITKISVVIVGYYSNYLMICNALSTLISQVGIAFTSSYGNLASEGNHQQMSQIFRTSLLFFHLFATIICSCFLCVASDFVALIFGESYVMDSITVFLIGLQLYFTIVLVAPRSVQNATGTHRYDALYMVIQAISSIVLSITLSHFMGINGILLGNMIPQVIFAYYVKGAKIETLLFKNNSRPYLFTISLYAICVFVMMVICQKVTNVLSYDNHVINFFVKGFLAAIISIALLAIVFWRDEEFKRIVNRVKIKLMKKEV